jgi:hypothetical protein
MSIGFTGTQIGLTLKQKKSLHNALTKLRKVEFKFRHGDCIGSDAEASLIAKDLNYKITLHPPINNKKRAFCEADEILPAKDYLDRNHDIVNCSRVVLGCPKEPNEILRSGTWSTIRYARKIGRDLIIIYPDGSIHKEIKSK